MVGDHEGESNEGESNMIYSVGMKNKREREMKGWEGFYGNRWLARFLPSNRLSPLGGYITPFFLLIGSLTGPDFRLLYKVTVAIEVGQGGAQCMRLDIDMHAGCVKTITDRCGPAADPKASSVSAISTSVGPDSSRLLAAVAPSQGRQSRG